MTHAPHQEFKSITTTTMAFQWNPHETTFLYPKWFSNMNENGSAFIVNNDKEKFITIQNKRGVYKAFTGDWVCIDQFGHNHVISQKTFNQRYQPSKGKS
jgi:hypothetical protein